jgi:predicted permease
MAAFCCLPMAELVGDAEMDNIVMLFLCLALGMILRGLGRVPTNTHMGLNAFIINVSLPALTLLQIHAITLHASLAFAVLMPWLLFAIGAVIFGTVGYLLKLPKATTGALIVVGSLGNTSFVGLPMIESFYGANYMPIGIIIDQLGTYLVLSTVGIFVICLFTEGAVTSREMATRILTFPPLIALAIAIVLIPVSYPPWLVSTLTRLGGTLAPLALVSVGLQLRLETLRGNRRLLAAGLGYKLLLAPALVAILYFGILGLRGPTMQVTLFEAGMAPQIGGSIVAIQYGLNPSLITLMVGIGTVLSFLTLPGWWYFFQ